MTANELKYRIEQAGHDSHFFTRDTMKFFGDTMRNFGVRATVVLANFDERGEFVPGGVPVHAWELYRKQPVKNGNKSSAYFDRETFRRIHPKTK